MSKKLKLSLILILVLAFIAIGNWMTDRPQDDSFGALIFAIEQGGTRTGSFSPNAVIVSGDTSTSALSASSTITVDGIHATSSTASTFVNVDVSDTLTTGTLAISSVVSSDLLMGGNDIVNAGTITAENFVATSTTASSTFAGPVEIRSPLEVTPVSTNSTITTNSSNASLQFQASRSSVNSDAFVFSNIDGTQLIRIDDDGDFGLGTDPSAPLHVYQDDASTTNNVGLKLEQDGTGDIGVRFILSGGQEYMWGIDNSSSDTLKLTTTGSVAGTGAINVTTGALVGIGSTAPSANLTIRRETSGEIFEISRAASDVSALYADLQSDTVTLYGNNADIRFGINNPGGAGGEQTFLTVHGEDGNVGIGTTTPSGQLVVENNTGNEVAHFIAHNAFNARLRISSDNADDADDNWDIEAVSTTVNRLDFQNGDTTLLSIEDTGDIGIGTTAPDGNLHVFSGSAGAITANSGADELVVESNGSGGMSILVPSSQNSEIFFGDENSNSVGRLRYIHSSDSMAFNTNSTERMRIDSDGDVGIGTTSPLYMLSVENSSEGNTLQLYDTDGNCLLDPDSGSLVTTCSSDAKLKTDIVDATGSLNYINKLRIREYMVIASGDRRVGVIAQEVQKTHPELVSDLGGTLGVSEVSSWSIIGAIQELYYKITKLAFKVFDNSARITELENENKELQKRLEAIEARL